MSTRELARSLLDQVPESKLLYVVAYLQGVTTPENDETPNAETLEAFEELDNGGGHTSNGPVENLIDSLLGDERARSKIFHEVQEGFEDVSEAALQYGLASAGH